jgi:hypothetical protein
MSHMQDPAKLGASRRQEPRQERGKMVEFLRGEPRTRARWVKERSVCPSLPTRQARLFLLGASARRRLASARVLTSFACTKFPAFVSDQLVVHCCSLPAVLHSITAIRRRGDGIRVP